MYLYTCVLVKVLLFVTEYKSQKAKEIRYTSTQVHTGFLEHYVGPCRILGHICVQQSYYCSSGSGDLDLYLLHPPFW